MTRSAGSLEASVGLRLVGTTCWFRGRDVVWTCFSPTALAWGTQNDAPREETSYKAEHFIVAAALLVGVAVPAGAQQPPPPPTTPYGPPIGLEAAKKAMAAAEAEALKNNWPMAIAILDSTGHIVMLHRLDNTQYGSIRVAEDKAHTALDFKRPSKVFEDLVAQGGIGMRTLGLRGATPLEGGVPIIADGKIIGAVGVLGATAQQDGQVAKVGADTAAAK